MLTLFFLVILHCLDFILIATFSTSFSLTGCTGCLPRSLRRSGSILIEAVAAALSKSLILDRNLVFSQDSLTINQ